MHKDKIRLMLQAIQQAYEDATDEVRVNYEIEIERGEEGEATRVFEIMQSVALPMLSAAREIAFR